MLKTSIEEHLVK